jgi:predicted glycoside hydrolase/deacetylase ChbG (UPF0249 family)
MAHSRHFPNSVQVIINADDLGISSSVTGSIIKAFEMGLVTSASIMANMPGFEMACEMIKKRGLEKKIGVHLNLSEGRPLTGRILDCNRFCNHDGEFLKPTGRTFFLNRMEHLAVLDELDAQIQKCFDSGITPMFLDSHRHQHTEWHIGKIVIQLALKHNIESIRIAFNCLNRKNPFKKCYRALFNQNLKRKGLARTKFCGSAEDIQQNAQHLSGAVEVMVHPVPGPENTIINKTSGEALHLIAEKFWGRPATRQFFNENANLNYAE